ncbi:MAG TPA: DUF481 domain-containing protein [Terriglobales bacterium]|nr:DUF481 domain-containing protein [Terriglobales bacterium]
MTGTVEKLSDSRLVIKSKVLGDLKVSLDEVARIESDKKVTVTSSTGVYEARSMNFKDERANLSISDSRAVSIPREEVVQLTSVIPNPAIPESVPTFWSNWYSSLDAGMSAARGNSSTTNVNLGAKAIHSTERDRLTLGVTSIFAQNSTDGNVVTSANATHGAARYDLNVSDRTFTFALANFDSNQLQGLDLRAVLGGGLGVRAAQTRRTSFDIFAGASMNQEILSDDPDRRSGEFITGQELNLKLSSRADFLQRLMFFPNFTDAGQYRVTFDSTASLKFNSWLGWHSTLSNTYLSNPAPGARANDMLVTTGIRFFFGESIPFKPKLKLPTSFAN